jgi:hypothetical protein
MQRRIKRGMISGSLSFEDLVVMANEHAFRSEHWRSGLQLDSPKRKG